MNHYYYDPKTNTLHGPIDRMPPGKTLESVVDDIEAFSIYEPLWNEFNSYLLSTTSHPHTFTGPSRVVPEGEIEWRYCNCKVGNDCPYRKGKWFSPCRVATPKITGEPSIPAHIVDDMKLDSYYDGFKDGAKMTGEGKKTSDNWYHEIYPKGELVIMDADGWDRTNWHHSWYVEMITREEFERRVAMSTVMRQKITATQAPGYTSTSGDECNCGQYVGHYQPECPVHGKLIGHIVDDFKNKKETFIPATQPLTAQPDKPNRYEYSNISEYLECYGDYVLRGTWNLPADFIAVNPPPSPTPEQGEKDETETKNSSI